jgi:hypothetical protein
MTHFVTRERREGDFENDRRLTNRRQLRAIEPGPFDPYYGYAPQVQTVGYGPPGGYSQPTRAGSRMRRSSSPRARRPILRGPTPSQAVDELGAPGPEWATIQSSASARKPTETQYGSPAIVPSLAAYRNGSRLPSFAHSRVTPVCSPFCITWP